MLAVARGDRHSLLGEDGHWQDTESSQSLFIFRSLRRRQLSMVGPVRRPENHSLRRLLWTSPSAHHAQVIRWLFDAIGGEGRFHVGCMGTRLYYLEQAPEPMVHEGDQLQREFSPDLLDS